MTTMIARAAVVFALLAAGAANAQGFTTYRPVKSMFIFNYEISSALGDFSDDFIDETSWRGFSFEGRSMVAPQVSIGFGVSYNRFQQDFSNLSVTTAGGGTLSGPLYRYTDNLALKGLIHGYLLQGPLTPYVGAGIGGIWAYSYSQIADIADSDDGFHFILSPEAGLMFTAARGASSFGLNAAIRYNYTTADFLSVEDAQWLSFVFGLFGAY